MRISAYLIMILCLAGMMSAQESQENQVAAAPQALGVRTVEGCLSTTNGIYTITGGGPGPKQYRIIGGDTSALRGKIEYTVRVTGTVAKNDPVENITTPYNEGTTTGAGWNTIMAQSIKVIHANCSEPGKEY